MKQALFVVSGVAIGLLAALVAVASTGPSSLLPAANAQAASPDGAQAAGNVIMGIGGATPNQNDLCWVMVKGKNRQGEDRYSLSLYKANLNGAFDLSDTSEITYDGKLVQLNLPSHNKDLAPKELKKKIEQAEHAEDAPARR